MTDYRIAVLLSAYNGEKYIEKQIESILKQENAEAITLIVRNDGSKDRTLDILREIQKDHSNVEIINGPNLGLVASFFKLLNCAVEREFDFYSFCDQDDYWLPEKLTVAVNAINGEKEACMYAACSKLTDGDLVETGSITQTQCREITFYNAAIQNFCPGHNQVMNHKMAEVVMRHTKVGPAIYSQDLWITNIASLTGKIIFDNTPHVLYRQHTNNQLSYGKSRIGWVKDHINRLKKSEGKKFSVQLKYFAECFDEYLNDEQRKELEHYFSSLSSFSKRLEYIFRTKLYRQKPVETLLFKLIYLFGGYNI